MVYKPTRDYSRVPALIQLAIYKINMVAPQVGRTFYPLEPWGYAFGGLRGMREEKRKNKARYKEEMRLWRDSKSRPSWRRGREEDDTIGVSALEMNAMMGRAPSRWRRRPQKIVAETSDFPIVPHDPLQDIANGYAERYKAAYAALDQTADDGHHNRKGGFVKRNGKSFWRRSTRASNPKRRS